MKYLSPYEKRVRRARRWWLLVFIIAVFVIISVFDKPLVYLFHIDLSRDITHFDLYKLFRIMGYWGTWIAIGCIYIIHDRNRHRGLALILAPLFAGLVAEFIKLVVARERPVDGTDIQSGLYHFRGLFTGFEDATNLGFPSSHAAVAFAGCLMLACYLSQARNALLLMAIGCAITRMLTGSHFASDVYVGALLGWGSASMMCHFASIYVPELRPRYRRPL